MKINNIAKNTSYFTSALVLQKVISFTYFTLIARALVPEDLGKYYFAISFTTIFAIFIDLGLANVLIRETAKAREKVKDLLGSVLAIKIPLAILSILSAIILVNILDYPELTKQLVYLSAICMILDSFSLTFFSVIRGFHNLIFESISSVIFQLVVIGFGLTVLYLGLGLKFLMVALVMASMFNIIYSSSLLRFKFNIKIKPIFNFDLIKAIIKIVIPFSMFAVFQRLYVYLDSVLLSVLADDKSVGLYQVAFKIVFALQFLPMAFTASLYPAFSSYWNNNKEQLVITFERAMNYLIIISLPISVGIIALADKIVLLFKSGYTEAILPLQVIMISLLFIFLNFPIGSLLNACDKQKINTRNMGIALVVSVILNLILIPKFQAVGASITVLATNFLMFVLGISYVPKIIKIRFKKIILVLLKVVLSVLIMLALILFLKHDLNIFIVVLLSGIVYFIALFLFKGFSREDVLSIFRSFLRKTH